MNQNSIYSDKIRKHRRLKFGAFAVGLTVVVCALVVIINAVFSALSGKFFWYADMTEEKVFGITDATLDLLNDFRGTGEFKISIVFCSPADQLEGSYYSKLVHNLAKKYAEEFDFVEVEYIDIINHPGAANRFLATTVSAPKTTSVYIVKHDLKNPDEEKLQSKIYTIDSFYTFDSDTNTVFAFNGEYKITCGILQLTGNSPIAYFTTGHGETTTDSVMWNLFADAGYEVKTIDLTREQMDTEAKVVVVNCPRYDFMGAGDTVNEIKMIDTFLDNNFGGLMVFSDAACGELPELEALLGEWGIAFEQRQVVDLASSLDVEGKEIKAAYATEGTASSLTSTLRSLSDYPRAIVNNAKPVSITYQLDSEGRYSKYIDGSTRIVSPVLTTSDSAAAYSLTDGSDVKEGRFDLMLVSVDQRYIENESHTAYVLAVGSSSFADDKYIGSQSYGNRDIIYNIMRNFSKKTVPLDLDFKVFEDEELDITTAEANRWTVVITVIPALVVFAVGIVIYTRRRYL